MKKASFYKGMGFMLLSATGMSLVGLFGKIGVQDVPVSTLMFGRYVSSLTLLFLVLFLLGRLKEMLDFQHIKLQLLRAFFVLLSQYCFFYYMLQNSLLNAAALLNTGPVFIALIEWGVLRKSVGVSTWIGALVSFMGALCILQPDAGIFTFMSLIGLLSGVSQGASQVVFGLHSEKEEKPHVGVMHLFGICTLLSFIPFIFTHIDIGHLNGFSSFDLTVILGLGAVSIINQLFRAAAYAHGSPSKLSPYLYFVVLLAGIWDWAIFGKVPNELSIIGSILVVLGGLLKIFLRNQILKKKEHP